MVSKLLKLACAPFTAAGRNYLRQRTQPHRDYFWVYIARRTWARHKPVIIVVGSFGKTTATRALLHGLGYSEGNAADSGNYGRLAAQKFRRQAWQQRHIVLEVGIDAPGLMYKRAAAFRPDVVVFLCVGVEHILSFRDQSHIAQEKAQALRALRPGGFAVINSDDPLVRQVATEAGVQLVRFGFESGADCLGVSWQLDWTCGSRLHYRLGATAGTLDTGLLSRAPTYALLATLATCQALGEDVAKVNERLQDFAPTPGRLELLKSPTGALIIRDDFKATLETIHLAIDTLAQFEGRRFIVLTRIDAPPHPQRIAYESVAEHAGRTVDEIIVVHAGRSYNYISVLKRHLASDSRLSKITEVNSSEEAVAYLKPLLRPGDCVLVKKCRERADDYDAKEIVALQLAHKGTMGPN